MQYTGANAAALARRRGSLTVLCYHRVLDLGDPVRARAHPALVTSTHVFERQMELIAELFHPVSLSATVEWLDGRGSIRPRAVLITFDDGWADSYTNAFPVMRRLSIPGTIFLATDFIGTNRRQWADAAYETIAATSDANNAAREVERLKRLRSDQRAEVKQTSVPETVNLTWNQVEEMARHGFEFGSHTHSHLILPREPEDQVRDELTSSADDLRMRLGCEPVGFAYPDGQYDEQSERLVEDAGYRCAFTCDEGLAARRSTLFALPRLSIHDGVSATATGDFSRAMLITYLAGTIPWRYRRRVA